MILQQCSSQPRIAASLPIPQILCRIQYGRYAVEGARSHEEISECQPLVADQHLCQQNSALVHANNNKIDKMMHKHVPRRCTQGHGSQTGRCVVMPSPLGLFGSKCKGARSADRLLQRDQQANLRVSCSATATAPSKEAAPAVSPDSVSSSSKPRVLVAGAGIGGLVLAVGLLNKGFEVQMFERDLTAIRGEGKYRGPIQVSPLFLHFPSC